MNFPTAVSTCFRKYATFSGGATRPEYWWFILFNSLVSLALALTGISTLRVLWSLAVLVPALAVAVRRHHDAGRSGWWLLAWLVPPWEIVLLCWPSKLLNNRYVPDRTSSYPTATIDEGLETSSLRCATCGRLRLGGQNYCVGCGSSFSAH